jgi:hypothetical protein
LNSFKRVPLSRVIIVMLIICFVAIVPVNLVRYPLKGEKLFALPWLYVFSLGLGFMVDHGITSKQFRNVSTVPIPL